MSKIISFLYEKNCGFSKKTDQTLKKAKEIKFKNLKNLQDLESKIIKVYLDANEGEKAKIYAYELIKKRHPTIPINIFYDGKHNKYKLIGGNDNLQKLIKNTNYKNNTLKEAKKFLNEELSLIGGSALRLINSLI